MFNKSFSCTSLSYKCAQKKTVATPLDATTSFLRLEPITQWEYITRKPPEDILCINQHSHGETDHVPLLLIYRPTISMQSAANWHCLIV